MGMQTDVKAVEVTSSNTAYAARTRVKSLTVSYAANGTVTLKDGGAGGTTRFSFTAPGTDGAVHIRIPGEGILFTTDVYAALTDTTVVVFYG